MANKQAYDKSLQITCHLTKQWDSNVRLLTQQNKATDTKRLLRMESNRKELSHCLYYVGAKVTVIFAFTSNLLNHNFFCINLIGKQNSMATLDDNLEISYKTKHPLTLQYRNSTPWYLPKGAEHMFT